MPARSRIGSREQFEAKAAITKNIEGAEMDTHQKLVFESEISAGVLGWGREFVIIRLGAC